MGLGEIRLGEMGLGEMGLGEMGQNRGVSIYFQLLLIKNVLRSPVIVLIKAAWPHFYCHSLVHAVNRVYIVRVRAPE